MEIKDKGNGRIKHFLFWLFLGKRILLSDDIKLICPRCESKMDKIEKNNITIDVCPYCNGLWLDDGEINKLNKIAQEDINKAKKLQIKCNKTKKNKTRKPVNKK